MRKFKTNEGYSPPYRGLDVGLDSDIVTSGSDLRGTRNADSDGRPKRSQTSKG